MDALNSPGCIQIAKLQSFDESNWAEEFAISSVVEGKVQEVKDIGVIVNFEKYHDVFGFIALDGCMFYFVFFLLFD